MKINYDGFSGKIMCEHRHFILFSFSSYICNFFVWIKEEKYFKLLMPDLNFHYSNIKYWWIQQASQFWTNIFFSEKMNWEPIWKSSQLIYNEICIINKKIWNTLRGLIIFSHILRNTRTSFQIEDLNNQLEDVKWWASARRY